MKIHLFASQERGFSVLDTLICLKSVKKLSVTLSSRKENFDKWDEEIFKLCFKNNLPVYFKKDNVDLSDTDLVLAVGWRYLIKNVAYSKLLIFHDSLLPKYRGFNPLVTALLNKDREVGISVIFGHDEYDKGRILCSRKMSVTYPTTISREIKRIASLCSEITKEVVEKYTTGDIGCEQDESNASYSLWRDDDDYLIDWHDSAESIAHFISIVGEPYAGAKSFLNKKECRIFKATAVLDLSVINRDAGKVLRFDGELPVVVCGKGLLRIEKANFTSGGDIFPLQKFRSKFDSLGF